MPHVLKGRRLPGIIDRLELEARERSRALVTDAEERAAHLRSAAEAEREEALGEARRIGREEGLASAGAALLAAAEARQRRLDGLEQEIAAVALEVARKLLGRTLAERPEIVTELARQALERVRARREVLVRVNPSDAPRLRADQPRLGALLDRAPGVSVREDAAIEPGGVVVETEAGRVDARFDAQLAILERTLGEGAP